MEALLEFTSSFLNISLGNIGGTPISLGSVIVFMLAVSAAVSVFRRLRGR